MYVYMHVCIYYYVRIINYASSAPPPCFFCDPPGGKYLHLVGSQFDFFAVSVLTNGKILCLRIHPNTKQPP